MYEIRLSKNAEKDLCGLDARWKASVVSALKKHLCHEPTKTSKSRIKRLKNLRLPQYRLRVDEIRVYYDVGDGFVMVHGIINKEQTEKWLQTHGIQDDHGTTQSS
jgi:mRNA interferase RelE/StbE